MHLLSGLTIHAAVYFSSRNLLCAHQSPVYLQHTLPHPRSPFRSFAVRLAVSSDLDAIVGLVAGTRGGERVLTDVKHYFSGRRDPLTEVGEGGKGEGDGNKGGRKEV